jgi:hypothetical protein
LVQATRREFSPDPSGIPDSSGFEAALEQLRDGNNLVGLRLFEPQLVDSEAFDL